MHQNDVSKISFKSDQMIIFLAKMFKIYHFLLTSNLSTRFTKGSLNMSRKKWTAKNALSNPYPLWYNNRKTKCLSNSEEIVKWAHAISNENTRKHLKKWKHEEMKASEETVMKTPKDSPKKQEFVSLRLK